MKSNSLNKILKSLWLFAKSDKAIMIIQIAAATAALVHAIEEYRKSNRKIGFK